MTPPTTNGARADTLPASHATNSAPIGVVPRKAMP
jgi:hypothetical protein